MFTKIKQAVSKENIKNQTLKYGTRFLENVHFTLHTASRLVIETEVAFVNKLSEPGTIDNKKVRGYIIQKTKRRQEGVYENIKKLQAKIKGEKYDDQNEYISKQSLTLIAE